MPKGPRKGGPGLHQHPAHIVAPLWPPTLALHFGRPQSPIQCHICLVFHNIYLLSDFVFSCCRIFSCCFASNEDISNVVRRDACSDCLQTANGYCLNVGRDWTVVHMQQVFMLVTCFDTSWIWLYFESTIRHSGKHRLQPSQQSIAGSSIGRPAEPFA